MKSLNCLNFITFLKSENVITDLNGDLNILIQIYNVSRGCADDVMQKLIRQDIGDTVAI